MLVAGVSVAQFPPDVKCLVSNGQGYAFGNPRQIAVGLASDIKVSPDGQYLAFRRIVPMDPLDEVRGKAVSAKLALSIWSSQSDQIWNVLESTVSAHIWLEFVWTSTDGQGTLVQSRSVQADGKEKVEVNVERVVARLRQRQHIARYVLETGARVDPSPNGRYILVPDLDGKTRDEILDVTTGQRQSIPSSKPGESKFWSHDSSLMVYRRTEGGAGQSMVLDPATGKVSVEPRQAVLLDDEIVAPFLLVTRELPDRSADARILVAQAYEGDPRGHIQAGHPVPPMTEAEKLLKSDPSLAGPIPLDLDPREQVVSAKGRFIAYAKRGGVYVCPFEPVDADYLRKLLGTRAQIRAMNKAKQVGTALMIYGADYDDLLPPNGNWQDIVNPYLKNRDLTNGFNYIMDGQNLAKIENPSTAEIGSVDTPYGRAVVYGDGHVKWVPATAPPEAFFCLLGAEDRRRGGA